MDLHIGYETVAPFAAEPHTTGPGREGRGAAGRAPKAASPLRTRTSRQHPARQRNARLPAFRPRRGTTSSATAARWNGCSTSTRRKTSDPTIREKFNTYRFADYKEKVIDLLAQVTTVSVETTRIVNAMRSALR